MEDGGLRLVSFQLFCNICLVEKNRVQISEAEYLKSKWTLSYYSDNVISDLGVNWVCTKYIKTENSPENLEKLQIMTDTICAWKNFIKPKVKAQIDNSNYIKIDIPPVINDDILQEFLN